MFQAHSLIFCPDCGTLVDPPAGLETSVYCMRCSASISSKEFEAIKVVTESKSNAFPKAKTLITSTDATAHLREGATVSFL
jgi:DNA-directed RNA polymerase I subunit RPA12